MGHLFYVDVVHFRWRIHCWCFVDVWYGCQRFLKLYEPTINSSYILILVVIKISLSRSGAWAQRRFFAPLFYRIVHKLRFQVLMFLKCHILVQRAPLLQLFVIQLFFWYFIFFVEISLSGLLLQLFPRDSGWFRFPWRWTRTWLFWLRWWCWTCQSDGRSEAVQRLVIELGRWDRANWQDLNGVCPLFPLPYQLRVDVSV